MKTGILKSILLIVAILTVVIFYFIIGRSILNASPVEASLGVVGVMLVALAAKLIKVH